MGKIKMAKEKVKKKKEDSDTNGGIMVWVILIIMVLSILGFAFMSGGGRSSSSSEELPENLEFQQFDNNGQIFWGGIRNSEQFIFLSLDGYENRTDLENAATKLKNTSHVNLYIDGNFTGQDSLLAFDKIFRAWKITKNSTTDLDCSSPTLVLTHNISGYDDNCIIFQTQEGNAFSDAQILAYHMIK
jgi:hypothetical protein